MMRQPIDRESVARDPDLATTTTTLPTGEVVTLRPLRQDDALGLGRYFLGLSAETTSRFGPHPFDQATADQLCATLDSARTLRLIGTTTRDGEERVVAYFILYFGLRDSERGRYEEYGRPLDPEATCTVAPSVADAYQDRGLGSAAMRHLIGLSRRLGYRAMVLSGGVYATNLRAVHYYEKHGFHRVGEFRTRCDNHDMVLDLGERGG